MHELLRCLAVGGTATAFFTALYVWLRLTEPNA